MGAETAQAPAAEAEPIEEEEPTMTFDEYEKANADKMAALNSMGKYEEVVIEADDAVVLAPKAGAEDEFALIFHDSSMDKKVFAKKEAREGYKQADQILNMKYVDPNADGGREYPRRSGTGKGREQTRGGGGRGNWGKGGFQAPRDNQSSGGKANIDLSNDMAFPTLGA